MGWQGRNYCEQLLMVAPLAQPLIRPITLFKEKINKENLRIKVGLITGDFYVYCSITERFPSSFH
jgi:hypothetical protein